MNAAGWKGGHVAALGLTALLTLYGSFWLVAIWEVASGHAQAIRLGYDVSHIVRYLTPAEAVLIFAATVFMGASFAGLVMRRRISQGLIAVAMLCHVIVWILLGDNPYYSAAPGFLVLIIEGLTLTLVVVLSRRGYLR
jgi:uncharacterized membrane protein (UPF0182 family)